MQYVIDVFEYTVRYLLSFPRFTAFHHLTRWLHWFLIEVSHKFSESYSQLRLTFNEVFWSEFSKEIWLITVQNIFFRYNFLLKNGGICLFLSRTSWIYFIFFVLEADYSWQLLRISVFFGSRKYRFLWSCSQKFGVLSCFPLLNLLLSFFSFNFLRVFPLFSRSQTMSLSLFLLRLLLFSQLRIWFLLYSYWLSSSFSFKLIKKILSYLLFGKRFGLDTLTSILSRHIWLRRSLFVRFRWWLFTFLFNHWTLLVVIYFLVLFLIRRSTTCLWGSRYFLLQVPKLSLLVDLCLLR